MSEVRFSWNPFPIDTLKQALLNEEHEGTCTFKVLKTFQPLHHLKKN